MTSYSVEPRRRNYVKEYGFLSFARNLSNKYGEKLLNTATKTEIDTAKTAFKKAVHKTSAAKAELLGYRVTSKIVEPKSVREANSRNVEEIVIPPEKIKKY